MGVDRAPTCGAEPPGLGRPVLGVLKLNLKSNGYDWDFESAKLSLLAPAGTAASYSDPVSGGCNGNGNGHGNARVPESPSATFITIQTVAQPSRLSPS